MLGKTLLNSTIFNLIFLAVFISNVFVVRSQTIGLSLLIVYLAIYGWKTGGFVARAESGLVRWWIGCLAMISFIAIILTVAYYTAFIPKELVVILILLTPPFLDILNRKFGDRSFFEKFHETWREKKHEINRNIFLAVSFIVFLGVLFVQILLHSQIIDPVRSPWEKLDPSVLLAMGLLLILLFGLLAHGRDRALTIPATSFVLFLFLSLVLFVFPVGYGFDSFIHRATENYLSQFGTITPKPFYYIGQYALVLFFHHGFVLPISVVDTYLVPLAAALFLPSAWYTAAVHITGKKRLAIITLVGLFLIPLSYFIVTTPQSLANLWTLLLILASTPYIFTQEKPRLLLLGLIAFATLSIHPIAGIPAVLFFALLACDPERAPKTWHTTARLVFRAIVVLSSVILPLTFLINAWLNKQQLLFKWSLPKFNFSIFFENRFNPLIDFVYLYGRNAILIFLIVAFCAWWIYRKELPKRVRILLLMVVALFVNYILMKTVVDFTFLINYERMNYSERLVPLMLFFLLPFFILGLAHLFLNLKNRPRSLFSAALILICAFALSAFYMTYPRRDAYETNRGFNVSEYDQSAVATVEEWAENEPYIALANQSVSAAAIEQIGFRYYDNLFFYPIPTGEPLYQFFLQMNENPTRETAQKALELITIHGDIKTVFFLVNNYWWDAPRIIETAKTTADDWRAIGNGAVHIFRYNF